MSIDCFGQNEPALQVNNVPHNPDDFTASWFEAAGCAQGLCPQNHFTVVIGPQRICHTVPDQPNSAGYRVECDASGTSGIFQACLDSQCSSEWLDKRV